MHIEPGLVADGKLWLSYLTATGAGGYGLKLTWETVRDRGILSFGLRSIATTALFFPSLNCCRTIRSAFPRCISSLARRCS